MARVRAFLTNIVPGITDVQRVALGPKETLQFAQRVAGSEHPWKFYASSMSDGTPRALGALVAVSQIGTERGPATIVGIEEPETALHPAAAGALVDALKHASGRTQVLLTTHSADLLDEVDPATATMLVVASNEGTSVVGQFDQASRRAIEDHLYTPGELLRMDQIEPDAEDLARQQTRCRVLNGVASGQSE